MKLSDVRVDAKLIEDGEWIGDLPGCGDLEVKIRGVNNSAWQQMAQRLVNALPRKERMGLISAASSRRINTELLIECAVLDWRNLTDEKGQPIPYSKEKCAELLRDPNLSDIFDGFLHAAGVVGKRSKEELEAAGKNSPPA